MSSATGVRQNNYRQNNLCPATTRGHPACSPQPEAFLVIADFDESAAETFGDVRFQLERDGLPIGAYDMLIAAHARSLGLICVTNDKGFRRVDGLVVEDWR